MSWARSSRNKTNAKEVKKEKKNKTIDIQKKQSFFDTLLKKRTHDTQADVLKCMICYKKITGIPEYCNNYKAPSKRCNAGPFCSNKCWKVHMENSKHY